MRAIGANWDGSEHGVLTDKKGALTSDFFVNIYDMSTQWFAADDDQMIFEGRDRSSGEKRYTATRADLIFGSDPQLRAVGEVYAGSDGHERLVHDFVRAWDKVMMLDRFELSAVKANQPGK